MVMVIKKCTKEVAGKALFRLFPIICFSDIQHDFLPNFFLISSKIYFQILKFKIQIYILKHFLKNLQNVVQCFSIILFFSLLFPCLNSRHTCNILPNILEVDTVYCVYDQRFSHSLYYPISRLYLELKFVSHICIWR